MVLDSRSHDSYVVFNRNEQARSIKQRARVRVGHADKVFPLFSSLSVSTSLTLNPPLIWPKPSKYGLKWAESSIVRPHGGDSLYDVEPIFGVFTLF